MRSVQTRRGARPDVRGYATPERDMPASAEIPPARASCRSPTTGTATHGGLMRALGGRHRELDKVDGTRARADLARGSAACRADRARPARARHQRLRRRAHDRRGQHQRPARVMAAIERPGPRRHRSGVQTHRELRRNRQRRPGGLLPGCAPALDRRAESVEVKDKATEARREAEGGRGLVARGQVPQLPDAERAGAEAQQGHGGRRVPRRQAEDPRRREGLRVPVRAGGVRRHVRRRRPQPGLRPRQDQPDTAGLRDGMEARLQQGEGHLGQDLVVDGRQAVGRRQEVRLRDGQHDHDLLRDRLRPAAQPLPADPTLLQHLPVRADDLLRATAVRLGSTAASA